MRKENPQLRQSSYNIVIPLSSQIVGSDEPTYILCNPLYGNASIISRKDYEALRRFPEIDDDAVLADLKDDRYITELTDEEEKTLMKERYEAQRNPKEPKDPRAAFVLTYQCNFRCVYCWSDHLFSHDEKCTTVIDEKTVDLAFQAIERIPVLHSLKMASLYGGEPFLPSTLSIVQYILEKGSERGWSFHANSNGYYLRKFVPLLAQHPVSGLGITLDGCSEIHDKRRTRADGSGTFHTIVEGIDAVLDAGIPVTVRINVDAENVSHLPTFKDWIEEHGWAHRRDIGFLITCVRPGIDNPWKPHLTYSEMAKKIVELTEEQPSLFKIMGYEWAYPDEGYLTSTVLRGAALQPRPFYCSAHYQGYIFDPFGDIYSCPRAVGDQRFSLGRFIPELVIDEKCDWFRRDVLSIPTCESCSLALLCGGGCAYEAYLTYNTLHEGYCKKYRAFLDYGMPLLVKFRMELDALNYPPQK